MTKLLIIASIAVLGLSACNAEDGTNTDAQPNSEAVQTVPSQTSNEHSGHDMSKMSENMGHGKGIVVSIGDLGDSLTIDHGPIEGIGMGAMTMGFDILSGVDLSGFSENDPVAFMVKKGRDNSYRITAICNTDKQGGDCLAKMVEH